MIPQKLLSVAEDVAAGNVRTVTVRVLLAWFKAERRGRWVVYEIQSALDQLRLGTKPNFQYQYIDGEIVFYARDHRNGESCVNEEAYSEQQDEAVIPYTDPVELDREPEELADTNDDLKITEVVASRIPGDPTYRIGRLASANVTPVSVKSNDSIETAVTHMMVNQYSQLPVLDGERTLRGKISWRSIGSRLANGKNPLSVSDCLEHCESISSDTSLFAAIDSILRDDCVVIRDSTQRVSGIVTAYDLSVQFNQLGEPFLLIGEIENHVRRLISNKFTRSELESARDPVDDRRLIADVSDLSFGECLRLIECPSNWARLTMRIDRPVLLSYLQEVREIRNDVMHFDPDGISSVELARLRSIARFFQNFAEVST